MEKSKAMAMLIALAAAMLVILAGKSCADDIQEKNKAHRDQSTAVPQQYVTNDYAYTQPPVTDPVTVQQPTEKMYEEVTNILGDVVETIPITTASPDPAAETQAEIPTETKSILESYNEKRFENVTTLPPYPTENPNSPQSTSTIVIELH